jgi:hypothetical protein
MPDHHWINAKRVWAMAVPSSSPDFAAIKQRQQAIWAAGDLTTHQKFLHPGSLM